MEGGDAPPPPASPRVPIPVISIPPRRQSPLAPHSFPLRRAVFFLFRDHGPTFLPRPASASSAFPYRDRLNDDVQPPRQRERRTRLGAPLSFGISCRCFWSNEKLAVFFFFESFSPNLLFFRLEISHFRETSDVWCSVVRD